MPVSFRVPLRAAAAAGLVFLVSAASAAAADRSPRPVDFAMGQAPEALSSHTKLANKVPTAPGVLVHIPTFRVEVVRELQKSADTRGLGGSGYAHQTSKWLLEGVDDAQMQAMTQALYDQLVADLKSRGFRVATPAETAAVPELAPLMAGKPSGARLPAGDGASSFYAPAGLQVVLTALDLRAPKGNGMAALGAFGAATSTIGKITTATKVAARGELVLEPKYTLNFATLSSSSEGFGGRFADTASVSGRAGLRVVEEGTRIDVIQAKGGGGTTNSASLTTPLMLSSSALGGVSDATTADQRAGSALGNVLGIALAQAGGSGSTVGMNSKAVRTGPLFVAASKDGLGAVQKALLSRVLAGQ